jgi:uncharacterized protein (TIGR03435 family)
MIEPLVCPRPIRILLLCSAAMLAIVESPAFGQGTTSPQAKLPSTQTPATQTQKLPEWQTAAGGQMSFEVASIRQDPSGKYSEPRFSLDSDDSFVPTGGLFTADAPLSTYISFAYKLAQQHSMLSHLPKWASTERFEIRARAAGNPTKDQMRLMMQSLLADRFKLAIHFETQELPVLVLTLIKPGKPGPRLRRHADGPACNVPVPLPASPTTAEFAVFPPTCNLYLAINRPDHAILAGARDTTGELMAAFFSNVGRLGRPVVDQTAGRHVLRPDLCAAARCRASGLRSDYRQAEQIRRLGLAFQSR